MKKFRRQIVLFLLLLCICILGGCGAPEEQEREYHIYYVNKENTKVVSVPYEPENASEQTDAFLAELISKLSEIPEKPEYVAPITGDIRLADYELFGQQLRLNFTETYYKQDAIVEILNRAAIVRTVTQAPNVKMVTFAVNGEALLDIAGIPMGAMTADTFIDNAGTEINTYEMTTLHLYFANEDGDRLVEFNREVEFNSNISLEKLVMENLIAGPLEGEEDIYPMLNPDTHVFGVTVQDGVCYVNLSKEFMTQIYNVSADVTIYAIANSLAELPNVNKVQLSIDGDTNIVYRENTSFTTVFERNLDVVEGSGIE